MLLPALAEADAGIEDDVAVGDAGPAGDGERALEEALHVVDDVDRRIDRLAVVHDDHRHAGLAGDRRHVRIALQAPDVVDDRGARSEREAGGRGLVGVDRDRHPQAAARARSITGSTRRCSSSAGTGV